VAVPATPYVGLTPFTESDAPFFFGREKERRLISANLLASRLTLLYGASGVGKSSIIRAGVQRDFRVRAEKALAAGLFPESIVVVFTGWRDDPVAGLADCVTGTVEELLGELAPDPPKGRLRLDDLLVEWNRLLDEKAVEHAGATADLDEPIRTELLVIFDQFEQYFVYHGEEDGPDTFAVQFPQAVNREELRGSFLISLREDAYTQLDRFEGRILNLFASNFRIDHLDERAAMDAIVKPVETYNDLLGNGGPPYRVEPGLVKAVITQVRAGTIVIGQAGGGVVEHEKPEEGEPEEARVETPFLQLVMSRLWTEEQRRNSHVLREQTLENLGGAEKIVRRHLDEAMSALDEGERAVAARMLHQLVTPSGTRIVHSAADLAGYAEVTEDVAKPILEQLDERRILRTIDPAPNEKTPRFEIRHDVLAGAVVEWSRKYDERRRREVEEARQRQQIEEERRRFRMRMLLGGAILLAFLIPAAIGGVLIWNARDDVAAQRDTDNSIFEAQDASRLLYSDPAQSARFGFASFSRHHATPVAEGLLRFALVTSHHRGVLSGHKGAVVTARFSPDGSRVATASSDGTARIWDPVTARTLAILVGRSARGRPPAPLKDVAFSPSGLMLATAAADGSTRLWDVSTGHLLAALSGPGSPLERVSFSPDGRFVVTAGDDGAARIWRTDDPTHALVRILRVHKGVGAVFSASFSPDGKQVVTAGSDGIARIWSVTNPRAVLVLPVRSSVLTASFSPDGNKVVTAGVGKVGSIWNAHTGRLLARLKGHEGPILHAEFSSGGRLIVTASADGTARLWRAADGKAEGILGRRGESEGTVSTAEFSRDGAFVVTAQGNVARVWRTASRNLVTTLRGHGATVFAASFSPDESRVVTAGADDEARLWDAGTGKPLTLLPLGKTTVVDLAVDPSSSSGLVALAGAGGAVQTWDVNTAGRAESLLSDAGSITSLVLSPNGKLLAATTSDGTTRVVDLKNRRTVLLPSRGAANDSAFSPDGKRLLVGYDGGSRIWNVGDRSSKEVSVGGPVTRVAFSPDGEHVITVAGNSAVVRDLGGRIVGTALFRDGFRIVDAAFSPDGKLVVTGASDGSATIWQNSEAIREFRGSRLPLKRVSFSSDGRFVLTTSSDGRARVWEADSQRPPLAAFYEGGRLTDAVLTPDNRLLVTASGAGVRVHACEACLPIADLLRLGNWTKEELRKP
jgi:WD40 repeat protein